MIRCPLNGREWLALALRLSSHVTMMVPRSTKAEQLASLPPAGSMVGSEFAVEVEDVAINYKSKMRVAYYGGSF